MEVPGLKALVIATLVQLECHVIIFFFFFFDMQQKFHLVTSSLLALYLIYLA